MKIPYKKLQDNLEKENRYCIKMRDLNRQFEKILKKYLGEELGDEVISDGEFIDSLLAYASNGEVQDINYFKFKLDEAIKKHKEDKQ